MTLGRIKIPGAMLLIGSAIETISINERLIFLISSLESQSVISITASRPAFCSPQTRQLPGDRRTPRMALAVRNHFSHPK